MSLINNPAPPLDIKEWVQGNPGTIEENLGKVILIEAFQVNCPGCFVGGLPEAIDVYLKNKEKPLEVWGLATAFEDYRLNSIDNLRKLLDTGEVVGETHRHLSELNMLSMDRLQYFIPFPVAWDHITPCHGEVSDEAINQVIHRDFPQFDSMPEENKSWIKGQVEAYLNKKDFNAGTFETYQMKGTPTAILIDKKGVVRHNLFGSGQGLEALVESLLDE